MIAEPNFSTFAGPMPSIARSSRGFEGHDSATAVSVRSCSTQYGGTRRRFASEARHSLRRTAIVAAAAERLIEAGCDELFGGFATLRGTLFAVNGANSSAIPSPISKSI